jgi:hypothetical protein
VLDEKPIPDVGALDALVRITTTTICGTDVHILKGEYPVAKGSEKLRAGGALSSLSSPRVARRPDEAVIQAERTGGCRMAAGCTSARRYGNLKRARDQP